MALSNNQLLLVILVLQVHVIYVVSERSCNHTGGFLHAGNDSNIIEGSVSTKCSIVKVSQHLFHHSFANHPSARPCPNSNIHAQSEALLLDACHPASSHTDKWRPGLKVIDNLSRIPKGEPIGMFINGVSQGKWAIFWNCHVTGSVASYEIIKQTYGSPATLTEAGHDEGMYYTLNW
ncbi:uncharacterized protein LOC123552047 [Mercenaria mercenaria]|uniref:uncharacterized protein LOC123552047 n=1 Tax=Mercenaria mercenaria TaxID=6596 RepID=UPI00234EA064|nr:uncharacterized protein LOC123552047 [Mercenaria mercenaria]